MNRFVRSLAASVALVAASLLPAHAELDVINLKKAIETSLASDYPKLDALYKELHAHPELAFQEVKTAARLAAEMRALGFDVTENVGKTGLVAIYRNGDGPTIMVRTELDGLPMEEKTGLDYASRDKTTWNGREVFVAHSCGHDIHMASWVGTAKTLLGLKDQWSGTLMFIAQPAEEIVAGARAMLADGLFTRFPKPDFGFALHAGPFASWHGLLSYRGRLVRRRRSRGHIPRPRRSRLGAAHDHRSRDDRRAVRRRCSERDQPRKGSDRIRRRQHRRHSRRHRGKHHSRLRAALRHHPLLQARGSRQNASPASNERRRPLPPCRMRPRPISRSPRAPSPS